MHIGMIETEKKNTYYCFPDVVGRRFLPEERRNGWTAGPLYFRVEPPITS